MLKLNIQMLCILYKNKLSIELFEMEQAKWNLCLTTVKYLAKMLLHTEWGKTILCNRYSNVGIITVLII